MSVRSEWRRVLCGAAVAGAAALALIPANNATAQPEEFPLGDADGAICSASAAYEDPAIQLPGARGWTIHCLGYEDAAFGHLYLFRDDGDAATGRGSVWARELAKRARCAGASTANVAGIGGVQAIACKSPLNNYGYSVYRAATGRGLVVAEGFDRIAPLVKEGMQIVADVAQPPAEFQAMAGGAESESLASVGSEAQKIDREAAIRLAYVHNQAYRFRQSAAAALAIGEGKASLADQARQQLIVAIDASDEGQFAEADRDFREADALVAQSGDPLMTAFGLNTKALHLLNQRKFNDAATVAQQSIAALIKIDPSAAARPHAAATNAGATITEDMATELNAGASFVAGATTAQKVQVLIAQDDYLLGCTATETGQLGQARERLLEAQTRRAASHIRALGLQADIAAALTRLDLKESRPTQAIADASVGVQALAQSKEYASSPHEARVYLARAYAEAAAGNAALALADYNTAFGIFRNSPGGVVGGSTPLAEPYFRLLAARAQDPARVNDFFQAAQIMADPSTAQTAREQEARLYLNNDALAANASGFQDANRRILIRENQLRHGPGAQNASAVLNDPELQRLRRQRDDLKAKLMADPRWGTISASNAVTLAQLQQVLRPNEVYVKTVLLPGSGYGIAVSKDSAQVYAIPLSRKQAAEAVTALRAPMDSKLTYVPDFDVEAANRLFASIFGPVQDQVRHAASLVYEPDGPLLNIPVGLLVTDPASATAFKARLQRFKKTGEDSNLYQGVAWLARNTDISLSLSATTLVNARTVVRPSNAPHLFAGFGGPQIRNVEDPAAFALPIADNGSPECRSFRQMLARGLRPLPGAAGAVQDIGSMLGAAPQDEVTGDAFTIQAVKARGQADLANYRLILFATHGLLPNAAGNACEPEPSLVTSDGLLDSRTILDDLKLNADLVVLSACNTGAAGSSAADQTGLAGSGEALSGLARDFIYAGSRGLVVSHWEVSAPAMVKLMQQLFHAGGVSQAAALRQAEIALMDDPAYYGHPYYWAAFSLVGDGEKPMPASQVAANGF